MIAFTKELSKYLELELGIGGENHAFDFETYQDPESLYEGRQVSTALALNLRGFLTSTIQRSKTVIFFKIRNKTMIRFRSQSGAYIYHKGDVYQVPKFLTWGIFEKTGVISALLDRYPSKSSELDGAISHVALMPGFGCNLSCSYCYQWDAEGVNKPSLSLGGALSPEKLARQLADYVGFGDIDITYLGGEPFVYLDYLTNFTIELRKLINIGQLDLVSNGTLMSKSIELKLSQMGANGIQISVDGGERFHDEFRSYKSGRGSYHEVLKNIARLSQVLERVNVRVNLTPNNIGSINELVDELLEVPNIELSKVTMMFCPIESVPSFTIEHDNWNAFLLGLTEAIKNAKQKGIKVLLQDHLGGCGTCGNKDSHSGIVLTANGLLYSCWDSAGQVDMQIGSLAEGQIPSLADKRWVSCGYTGELTKEQRRDLLYANLLGVFS